MKKNFKTIVTVIAVLFIVVLVVINRNSVKKQEEMADKMQLSFIVNGGEKIYYYDETSADYINFDTQMKRKNGDVFDKTYSGIEMAVILKDIGVNLSQNTDIHIVCADNYEIRLSADEIMEKGNIYLITKENGNKLAEADGPFMLVINNDEFSTRWAKNVVQVKVNEK
ncbi:MAG: molybdopterin-dependent oxidoreductase [Oscillospiraceae bacterium]|nr:molybdopterin-dependent oxidoreductase [Oscillospiraceae bacterium]